MITDTRIIEMIDEFVEEPNSIDREWMEAMFYIRQILKSKVEKRLVIMPVCQNCGLINAWRIDKRDCDRCGSTDLKY